MQTLGTSLLESYLVTPGLYDEMLDEQGQLRSHAKKFCDLVDRLGLDEFSRRWDHAQTQLEENGLAYGPFRDDDSEGPRPWDLDPLPLLVPADQWQVVSQALVQRADLLNRILADLYGPQTLLTDGLLPPELLFAHDGFRRSYHGYSPPGGRYLHVYAADLARAHDGSWWVMADRTEAPSGLGHVLENRIVLSRMLPSVFHSCLIERLAPFFISLQSSLVHHAPAGRENLRTVLLGPGPNAPGHFEDAYLARYLGYVLVQPGDLAVRNGRVQLKTLRGLLPVDVVLRRTNSESCDPLELDEAGGGGPVGLMQAVRTGHVTVANSLGAGLVESPVFQAFLPRLCEQLLDSELRIPNVATWWCGQPECHKYVVEHLDELIIRRAFRRRGDEQEFNRRLSELSADQLRDLIATAPHQYVGQERVTRSTAPVWTAVRQLSPAYIALRAYVAADGDSYTVMQGALARTSAEPQPLEISILSGEGSKDVWVVSSQPVKQVSLLPTQGTGIRLRRGGAELPSRVAEDLFWVGRYLERGDAHARLLRTLVARLTDETSVESVVELPALLRALAKQGQIEPGFAVEGMRDAMPAIDQTLPAAVLDETQSGGLRSTISAFFRTASQVRDRLSLDSWRIVRRIDRRLRLPRGSGDIEMSDLPAVLDRLIVGLAAFSGLVMESMTRSLGWRFLDMGRRLERAQQVTGMVMSMLERHRSCPPQVLEALLASADSLMTYRSRYLSDMQVAAVLDLLVTDETNPRSLAFQLAALVEHVGLLPRDHSLPQLAEEQRLAMSLLHEIRMTDVTVLAEAYNLGQWEPLRQVLEEADQRLPRLSDALYHRYLIHSGPAWQLSDIRPGIES